MRVDLPLADLLTALVAGGAVVLGVCVGIALLIRSGGRRRADVFLALFLIAGGLTLLNEVVSALALYHLSSHLYVTPLLYTFALGPLIAGFIKARSQPGWRLGWRDAPHAVIPLWQVVHEVVTGFAPLSFKSWFWQTTYAQIYSSIDTVVFALSFGAYLVVAHRLAQSAPDTEQPWLVRLVAGCGLILAIAIAIEIADSLAGDLGGRFDWFELGASMAYAALIYWMALTGWVHTRALPVPQQPTRQETYGIDDDALARHADALRRLVADEQPYLDADLTLGTLARRLRLSDKELSYVLNQGLGTGYADYINGLRVAESQRRLRDPAFSDATVLEIAMASGFASKPTFNRVFKKATGETPTAFRAGSGRLMAS